jgi:hypothetical protein
MYVTYLAQGLDLLNIAIDFFSHSTEKKKI